MWQLCDPAPQDISKHLPFTYNMVASASYSYLPAFKAFGQKVTLPFLHSPPSRPSGEDNSLHRRHEALDGGLR